ncbi:hypothetical protein CHLRE_17g739650v5 [Chlamydomonas reinhardtii]|uniref:Protein DETOXIFICATION n=1 Tax=Chlamydomonas reinhardtii TaxID=3055 RepID=A0A2K3CRN9_CHLRE|nr:uncharacterized protein CHLRE_17g739650v5 [Chlamydomonas reinhardtii]PNW70938.1 hypothetical protein CHLRE_17g739650v5 [Chlamydomonas reinhardtii]
MEEHDAEKRTDRPLLSSRLPKSDAVASPASLLPPASDLTGRLAADVDVEAARPGEVAGLGTPGASGGLAGPAGSSGAAAPADAAAGSWGRWLGTPYRDRAMLDHEIFHIALPMLAALATDPIAGLVDSIYMGHAGSTQLAAVGVALSIFNTATKLVNAPLVAVTTSAVAMASGIAAATASSSQQRANTASSSAAGAAAGAVAATASGAAAAASNTTGGGGGGGGCGGGGGGAVQLAATSRNGSGALQSRGARAGAADGGGAGAAGAAGTDSSGGGLYRRLSLALSQTLAPQRSGQLAAEAENGAGAAAAKAAAAGLVDPHADSTVTEPLLAAETVSSSATSSSSNSHVANFATTTSSSGSGSGISISATAAATAAETVRVASACMLLALLLGGLQAAVLLAAGPGLLHVWGIRRGVSPVFGPALGFLMVRALGAPAATLMLAVQGVFRGLQDTTTPLRATILASFINIVLAPALVFGMRMGAAGAAIATVTSQVVTVGVLLRMLRRRLLQQPQAAADAEAAVPLLTPPPAAEVEMERAPAAAGGASGDAEERPLLGGAPAVAAAAEDSGSEQRVGEPLAVGSAGPLSGRLSSIGGGGGEAAVAAAALSRQPSAAEPLSPLSGSSGGGRRASKDDRRWTANAATGGGFSSSFAGAAAFEVAEAEAAPAGGAGSGGAATGRVSNSGGGGGGGSSGVGGSSIASALLLLPPVVEAVEVPLWRGLYMRLWSVAPLLKPTGFMVLRSASVTATYAVATALTARAGAASTASHQICLQVWLSASLLADALAVAAQSLMARDLGAGCPRGAAQVARRVAELSLGLGMILALGLAAGHRVLPRLFSKDPEVLRLVEHLLLFVAGMEPLTVMAMAWDGILYGAGGFAYAAFSMLLAAAPALLIMLLGVRYGAAAHAVLSGGGVPPPPPGVPAADVFAGPAAPADATGASVDAAHWYAGVSVLGWVWLGLAVLMLMRWATIAVPYVMRVGVFRKLRKVA